MPTPHKHAELIKKWADGAEIEVLSNFQGWQPCTFPSWMNVQEYRVKPEPESSMTITDCYRIWAAHIGDTGLKVIADEAVRRYVRENSNKS